MMVTADDVTREKNKDAQGGPYTPEYQKGYEDGFTDGGSFGAPLLVGVVLGAVAIGLVRQVGHLLGWW